MKCLVAAQGQFRRAKFEKPALCAKSGKGQAGRAASAEAQVRLRGERLQQKPEDPPAGLVGDQVDGVNDEHEGPGIRHRRGQCRQDACLHRRGRELQPLHHLRIDEDHAVEGRREALQEDERVVVGGVGLERSERHAVVRRPLRQGDRLAVAAGSRDDEQRRLRDGQPPQELLAPHQREERQRWPQTRPDQEVTLGGGSRDRAELIVAGGARNLPSLGFVAQPPNPVR